MISLEIISLQTTTKCHTTRHQTVFFKGWEFFVLTSMRWYVERVSLEKKKAGGASAAAAVGATAAFLQARESSSLLTLRGCSGKRPPGQTSLARHTASIASVGTMQLKEKEMANYVEGSMQYSRSPSKPRERPNQPPIQTCIKPDRTATAFQQSECSVILCTTTSQ